MSKKPVYREHRPARERRTPKQQPTVETNQPITKWEINDSIYSEDRQMVTFYNGETKLGHMEIAPETTEDMVYAFATLLGYKIQIPGKTPNLNIETTTSNQTYPDINDIKTNSTDPDNDPALEYFANSSIPDSWFITRPEDPTATPHLYFTEEGEITTIVPLTPELIEGLLPRFKKIHNPKTEPEDSKLVAWFKGHNKTSILLIILLGGFVIYSIISTYFLTP